MDQPISIEGVVVTPLKVIDSPLGSVYHGIKGNEETFQKFGEAYFSTVIKGAVKGWKKHNIMHSNLIVPNGKIKFVLFDGRDYSSTKGNFFEIFLSMENYKRLTIPSGVWFAFQGLDDTKNLVLNISSIMHDPSESEVLPINTDIINYDNW